MFVAAVLQPDSARQLRNVVDGIALRSFGFQFVTDRGSPLPHHMTLNLGKFDNQLNDNRIMTCPAELRVSEIVYDLDLGCCAAPVIEAVAIGPDDEKIPIRSANSKPHITCCLKKSCKPKLSNYLLECPSDSTEVFRLEKAITLQAVVTTCA